MASDRFDLPTVRPIQKDDNAEFWWGKRENTTFRPGRTADKLWKNSLVDESSVNQGPKTFASWASKLRMLWSHGAP